MQLLGLLCLLFLHCSIVYASLRKHATGHRDKEGIIHIIGGSDPDHTFASPHIRFQWIKGDLVPYPPPLTSDLVPSLGHTSHQINQTFYTLFGLHPPHSAPQTWIQPGPKPRYHHTSLILHNQLYLLGGRSAQNDTLLPDAWRYSFAQQTWHPLPPYTGSGHVSFSFKRWIVSCFGLSEACVWLDTTDHTVRSVKSQGPSLRTFASLTAIDPGRYLLFGGESPETQNELWQLDIPMPWTMHWTRLAEGQARSGHLALWLDPVLMIYGGQGPPLFWHTTRQAWHTPQPRVLVLRQSEARLEPGAVGGLVVVVALLSLALVLAGLYWHRQRTRTKHSKAAQFSARMNAPYSEKTEIDSFDVNAAPFMSLPELAVHTPRETRLSTLSLGTTFKFSAQDFTPTPAQKRKSSALGLKRLTQQLFSHEAQNPSRASLGTKSVASVQWVGFNDTMDYKGWQNGSHSNIHLAVKNAGRASLYTNDSAQSTPKSPLFPHHLSDSVVH